MSNEKTKKILITVCVILAVALVIGLNVYDKIATSGFALRSQTAAASENYKVDGMMMTYFYNNSMQSYIPYFSYFGVDTNKSLKDQAYSEDQSWFDYFVDASKQYVNEILTLCEYAKANGIELSEESKASMEESIKTLEANAANYGYTTEQYLYLSFGPGMKLNDVRKCLELTSLADTAYAAYSESIDYTDDELKAYADANPDKINGIDYLQYTTKAADFIVTDEAGKATSTSDEDKAAAKAAAEEFAAAKSVEEFKSLVVAYLDAHHEEHEGHDELENVEAAEMTYIRHALKSDITDEDAAKWAFEEAKAGDTKIEVNEKGDEFTIYYVAKTAYVDETVNRSVRHILFTNETYKDDTKAKEIYAEWEAAEFSEEKFIELEYKYNEDTGSHGNAGVYEEIAIGQTETAFDEWLFDADRKVGDHSLVETSYGWHIMEYLGEADSVAWEISAQSEKAAEEYQALIEETAKTITYNDGVIAKIDR